jgi:hypothetical protein
VIESQSSESRHDLSFIALLSFMASFLTVRVFATLFPGAVIVNQGIHFHHFWYGIALIAVVGWLAISWRKNTQLDRIYAVAYGVGAGLVGDEVGLLLTLGNYTSELTYGFFVGAVSIASLTILLLRFKKQVFEDIFGLKRGERLTHFGVFFACLSIFFIAFNSGFSVTLLIIGAGMIIIGRRLTRHEHANP